MFYSGEDPIFKIGEGHDFITGEDHIFETGEGIISLNYGLIFKCSELIVYHI